MIRLIVGLGNPGLQYHKTRHNAGFLFLDHMQSKFNCLWRPEPSFSGLVSSCLIDSQNVFLLKPLTFMNVSGLSVGKFVRYYKIKPDECLVVHDDLDIQFGSVRMKFGGGHAGHNGVRDIAAQLNSNEFYRLRIGIGRPTLGLSVSSYVLSDFSKKELEVISVVFNSIEMQLDRVFLGEFGL